MRFLSQDPDIETIVRRIKDGDYDLQPDFQRGEVWTTQKKKRLIDSILRGWHIPPIHLVAREDERSDVLDGQQRLTAIRDFVQGKFPIDGNIEPISEALGRLDGLRFGELPESTARTFRKSTIRVFELVDFQPDEPHELFFRLNQPTSLTEAEKRNAFVGTARNQVRDLTAWATESQLLTERIGFSNARMAYDDMLARSLVTLEVHSLDTKITASLVTSRYREGSPFAESDVAAMQHAMQIVLPELYAVGVEGTVLRPNRATLHTWLTTGAQLHLSNASPDLNAVFVQTVTKIEAARWLKQDAVGSLDQRLIEIFQNRSTARVADVSSIIVRDLVTWMFMVTSLETAPTLPKLQLAAAAWEHVVKTSNLEESLLKFASAFDWGKVGWE
ncbi:DUF262 domain-containing protein [Pseudoclavibacter sp. RFBG4]|uniref:DUF262 domain-containing protein n=1 Tax=Pseudoclavibacter sp. RFBG4 TaxID=2080575 RepID=UPI0015E3A306|nr:DUF262 domain-containing protein [Pseudoclavibacter sp. RFBG4]